MRTPRSRRALLSAVVPFTTALAGCFEDRFTSEDESTSAFVSEDEYDCDDIDRPEPDEPSHDDALKPVSYPSPESFPDGADEFALEFEEAYRLNTFLDQYGTETRWFEFQFEASQLQKIEPESERDAVRVSLIYTLSTGLKQGRQPTEYDTRVTYYVDENVALRARHRGVAREPTFDPDPRSAGSPVACFE